MITELVQTRCRYSDTTQRLITKRTQVLFNAGPPVRRSPSVKTTCTYVQKLGYMYVTVPYRVCTHAHNTLTVAQPC